MPDKRSSLPHPRAQREQPGGGEPAEEEGGKGSLGGEEWPVTSSVLAHSLPQESVGRADGRGEAGEEKERREVRKRGSWCAGGVPAHCTLGEREQRERKAPAEEARAEAGGAEGGQGGRSRAEERAQGAGGAG